MKKITSLFLSLILAISITSSHADHHEKSVENEIQAALKAGKITEEEAFKQIKDLYKQFKYYYKHTVKPRVESMDKKGYYK